MRGELGIVAAHFGDEALGVFARQEHVDGLPERVLEARSVVETGQTYPIAALVRAQPTHLPVAAR